MRFHYSCFRKLDVEAAGLKLNGLMLDWVEYIKGLCMEEVMIAHQVRKQGKSLQECMAVLLKYSFNNRTAVAKEIVKAAKISASRVDSVFQEWQKQRR